MEKEQFNQIISDMHLLQDADVKELRLLIEKYPWFQLPQILLAKKLHIEHSPHYDAALKKAATFIYDRSVLFQLIERTSLTKMQYANAGEEQEEVIEHVFEKEIISNAFDNPAIPVEENIPDKVMEELMKSETFEGPGIENNLAEEQIILQEETPEEPIFEFNLYELQMLKESNEAPLVELVKDITGKTISVEEKEIIDQPETHTFSEWLQRISGPSRGSVVELSEKHKPLRVFSENRKTPGDNFDEEDANILAAKSIRLHDSLITETYAQILAQQGKKVKAVEMYEKLRLKYPQKSTYFAEKIKEL